VAGEDHRPALAGKEAEVTRFYLVSREIPCMLHEPLKKIGSKTLLDFYWFKDRSFEETEIKYGLFENTAIE
jgi:hypothetical protein